MYTDTSHLSIQRKCIHLMLLSFTRCCAACAGSTSQSYILSLLFCRKMSPRILLTSEGPCDLKPCDQCPQMACSSNFPTIVDEPVICTFAVPALVIKNTDMNRSYGSGRRCGPFKPAVSADFLGRSRMMGVVTSANPAARAAMLQAIDTGAAPSSMDRDDQILARFTKRSHRVHITAPATRLVRAAEKAMYSSARS